MHAKLLTNMQPCVSLIKLLFAPGSSKVHPLQQLKPALSCIWLWGQRRAWPDCWSMVRRWLVLSCWTALFLELNSILRPTSYMCPLCSLFDVIEATVARSIIFPTWQYIFSIRTVTGEHKQNRLLTSSRGMLLYNYVAKTLASKITTVVKWHK